MAFVRQFNIREGIVSLWSMHTTCALFINEFQTALLTDIKRFLEQMVARDAEWMHNDPEHSDCDRMNADSHLRALLLGHSLTLQVSGGEVVLGQWQRILMAELDGPRARIAPRAGHGHRLTRDRHVRPRRLAVRSASADIAEKLDAGERLSLDDGVRLFDAPGPARASAGSPTASASSATARAPTTTTTSGSRRRTSAWRAACSARSRG